MTNQRRIIAAFIIIIAAATCRPMSHRERLLRRDRDRLVQRIEAEREARMRLREFGPGTTTADVEKQLGGPGSTAPCPNVEKCSYYDISGQKYFVCFDKRGTVVCRGQTNVFRD